VKERELAAREAKLAYDQSELDKIRKANTKAMPYEEEVKITSSSENCERQVPVQPLPMTQKHQPI